MDNQTQTLTLVILRNTHGNGASQGQVDLNFDVITTTNQVARSRIRGQESTSDAPYRN